MFGVAAHSLTPSQRKSEAVKPVTLGTPLKIQPSLSSYFAPAASASQAARPSRRAILERL
jgi:hypothetical protein